MVLWARPEDRFLHLIEAVQTRLGFLGDDLYMIRRSHVHLSVLEISHRHPVSHLESVAEKTGQHLLQEMLGVPHRNLR